MRGEAFAYCSTSLIWIGNEIQITIKYSIWNAQHKSTLDSFFRLCPPSSSRRDASWSGVQSLSWLAWRGSFSGSSSGRAEQQPCEVTGVNGFYVLCDEDIVDPDWCLISITSRHDPTDALSGLFSHDHNSNVLCTLHPSFRNQWVFWMDFELNTWDKVCGEYNLRICSRFMLRHTKCLSNTPLVILFSFYVSWNRWLLTSG